MLSFSVLTWDPQPSDSNNDLQGIDLPFELLPALKSSRNSDLSLPASPSLCSNQFLFPSGSELTLKN